MQQTMVDLSENYQIALNQLGRIYGESAKAAAISTSRTHLNSRTRWALWYQLAQAGWRNCEISTGSGYGRHAIEHGVSGIEYAIKYPSNGLIERKATEIATCKRLAAAIRESHG